MGILKLMIVDSQPTLGQYVRQALSTENWTAEIEVLECALDEDYNKVIILIAANLPDIVILDIGYPVLSGLNVSKIIARTFPETGVIIISTNPAVDDNELFEVTRSGAAAYLRIKHTRGAELSGIVKQVLNGEHPLSNSVSNRPEVARHILGQFQDRTSTAGTLEEIVLSLTYEETQTLTSIAEGDSINHIAYILGISEQTIRNRVTNIIHKLNTNARAYDISNNVRNGLLSIRLARDGNLFVLNAMQSSCQLYPLLDSPRHT